MPATRPSQKGTMNWTRRSIGVTIVLLSVIGLMLSLIAIGGVWVIKVRVSAGATELLTSIEATVDVVNDNLDRVGTVLQNGRKKVASVVTEIEKRADGDQHTPLTAIDNDVVDGLKDALAMADSLKTTTTILSKTVEAANSGRFVSLRQRPVGEVDLSGIHRFSEGLADALSTAQEARKRLAEDEKGPALAEQGARQLAQVDEKLAGIQGAVQRLRAATEEIGANAADLKDAVPSWLTVWTIVATVFFAWFGMSQISLIVHGWPLVRR